MKLYPNGQLKAWTSLTIKIRYDLRPLAVLVEDKVFFNVSRAQFFSAYICKLAPLQ